MVILTVPSFPFENKVRLCRQNIMIRRGAPVLLIFYRNECKNELERQRSQPIHKLRNNEEIADGNDGQIEKADDEDSGEDRDGITTECDFDLNFAGTDEEQWVMLSKKTIRSCLMRLMTNKNFMDFKTCKNNGILYYKNCRLKECSSIELCFYSLFFHRRK